MAQANMDTWVRWKQLLSCVFLNPLFLVTVGHLEGLEVFPCPTLRVPKIFDSNAAKIGNGASFTKTTYSQAVTGCVKDERVVENGLSKNLRVRCKFGLC
jgi:hypothetical protein